MNPHNEAMPAPNKKPSKSQAEIKKNSAADALTTDDLRNIIVKALEDMKAEDVQVIDIRGKSSFADAMVVASGTSQRHVASLADAVVFALKQSGYEHVPTEGKEGSDWVLVDVGDIIVHLFRPEVRERYNLEKMWSVIMPDSEN